MPVMQRLIELLLPPSPAIIIAVFGVKFLTNLVIPTTTHFMVTSGEPITMLVQYSFVVPFWKPVVAAPPPLMPAPRSCSGAGPDGHQAVEPREEVPEDADRACRGEGRPLGVLRAVRHVLGALRGLSRNLDSAAF